MTNINTNEIAWSDWSNSVCRTVEKYLSIDPKVTDQILSENFYQSRAKRARLATLLETVLPYCENYRDKTDPAIKKKVFEVLFKKLDYSQFGFENYDETKVRLNDIFSKSTQKGINPYKIIYCQVLTDAGATRDQDNRKYYYDETRKFESIYKTLRHLLTPSPEEYENNQGYLALSHQEKIWYRDQLFKQAEQDTNAIIEKCSTIIAKSNSYKIRKVYETIRNWTWNSRVNFDKCYYVFTKSEIRSILRINPTLFCTSVDTVEAAKGYVFKRIDKLNLPGDKPMNEFRFWIKNSSTLLTMNINSLLEKQRCIYNFMIKVPENRDSYINAYKNIFSDKVDIAIVASIPKQNILDNAVANMELLEEFLKDKTKVGEYLQKNIYAFGFDKYKFSNLLNRIYREDVENPDQNLMAKFLRSGQTVFGGNVDFKVDDIVSKLKNNTFDHDDIDSLSDKECLDKFLNIFFENDDKVKFDINRLISEKEERNRLGEADLRRSLRTLPMNLENFKAILKDTTARPAENVLRLCKAVDFIAKKRFTFVQKEIMRDSFGITAIKYSNNEEYWKTAKIMRLVAEKENEISNDIETTLNILRDEYNKRGEKMKKKYEYIDKLFDKTMAYLDKCFDDKVSMSKLYKDTVVEPFKKILADTFESQKPNQISLFEDDEDNLEIIIKDNRMRKGFKDTQKSIAKSDPSVNDYLIK